MVIGPSVVMCLSSLLLTTEMEILLKPSLPPSQPFRSQDRPENTQAHVREHFAACDCAPHAERQATNGTGGGVRGCDSHARAGPCTVCLPAHGVPLQEAVGHEEAALGARLLDRRQLALHFCNQPLRLREPPGGVSAGAPSGANARSAGARASASTSASGAGARSAGARASARTGARGSWGGQATLVKKVSTSRKIERGHAPSASQGEAGWSTGSAVDTS